MIANNIWSAIGDFFTNIGFAPYDWIRNDVDNWWVQNSFSWILALITMYYFVYWMRQLSKFKKEGNQ